MRIAVLLALSVVCLCIVLVVRGCELAVRPFIAEPEGIRPENVPAALGEVPEGSSGSSRSERVSVAG